MDQRSHNVSTNVVFITVLKILCIFQDGKMLTNHLFYDVFIQCQYIFLLRYPLNIVFIYYHFHEPEGNRSKNNISVLLIRALVT